jgi:hypothetical protein
VLNSQLFYPEPMVHHNHGWRLPRSNGYHPARNKSMEAIPLILEK